MQDICSRGKPECIVHTHPTSFQQMYELLTIMQWPELVVDYKQWEVIDPGAGHMVCELWLFGFVRKNWQAKQPIHCSANATHGFDSIITMIHTFH